MQTFKTIKGEVIRVSSNKTERRFTLKISGGRYKTNRMLKSEFECRLKHNGNDWKHFLKTSNNYHKID